MNVPLPARLARAVPLLRAFEAAGHEIYFVGGCVRDLLIDPEADVDDIDLATSALPEASAAVIRSMGLKPLLVGARFGTVAVLVRGTMLEITTFRAREEYPAVGRHPEVTFGSNVVEDLQRRDLSINAMAMNADGDLVDPWDGRAALRARCLEVPGGGYEHTISIFRDDPLRILRVARFFGRFGFQPTLVTGDAARATASELSTISAERIRGELEKTLRAPHVEDAIHWLVGTGALATVLPELGRVRASALPEQLAYAREDGLGWAVIAHQLAWALAEAAGASAPDRGTWDAAARLLHDRLRFSHAETRVTRVLMEPTIAREALADPSGRESLRRWDAEAGEFAERQMRLWRALAPGDEAVAGHVERWIRARREALAEGPLAPALPHRVGSHLQAAVPGLRGSALGEALGDLREALFRGDLPNPPSVEACVAWVRASRWGADEG